MPPLRRRLEAALENSLAPFRPPNDNADMARGNQRDKAREKNLKDAAGKVCEPGECFWAVNVEWAD